MRYVISDDWGHIFDDHEGEVSTRIVYDTIDEKLVAAMVDSGDNKGGPLWTDASSLMIADLEDSLKNANDDALENPDRWGLTASDDLPEWAASQTAGHAIR